MLVDWARYWHSAGFSGPGVCLLAVLTLSDEQSCGRPRPDFALARRQNWNAGHAETSAKAKNCWNCFSQSDGFMMLVNPCWDAAVDRTGAGYAHHQRITKINEAMAAHYGVSREAMLGRTPRLFAHDPIKAGVLAADVRQGTVARRESEERKADGTSVWIDGDYLVLRC